MKIRKKRKAAKRLAGRIAAWEQIVSKLTSESEKKAYKKPGRSW